MSRTSEVKPIPLFWVRFRMIFSSPAKAPPQMNRILLVSTCRNSCCGCLRPPCGGTEAIVPSMSFSSACCTPSPETSRSEEHTSELQSQSNLVCRLLLEKKKIQESRDTIAH